MLQVAGGSQENSVEQKKNKRVSFSILIRLDTWSSFDLHKKGRTILIYQLRCQLALMNWQKFSSRWAVVREGCGLVVETVGWH